MEQLTASIRLQTIGEADRLFMDLYRDTDCIEPIELTDPDAKGLRTFRVLCRDRPDSAKPVRRVVNALMLLTLYGFSMD